jgi:hypothetical protein
MEPEGSLLCSQQPATGPYLSQMNAVHTFPPYFPEIHSNIIFPSTLTSSDQNFVYISHMSVVWPAQYLNNSEVKI